MILRQYLQHSSMGIFPLVPSGTVRLLWHQALYKIVTITKHAYYRNSCRVLYVHPQFFTQLMYCWPMFSSEPCFPPIIQMSTCRPHFSTDHHHNEVLSHSTESHLVIQSLVFALGPTFSSMEVSILKLYVSTLYRNPDQLLWQKQNAPIILLIT